MGGKHQGAVLTLAERKTQFCLMYPLESKRSDEVQAAMIEVLQPFIGKIRSITLDNGKEFAGHEGVSEALGTQVYFAHPYSSWERGLNENTNGLIRQYLKKGESLLGLSLEECNDIADRPLKGDDMSKRRKFNAEFKGKVALEALREDSTLSEIANKYNLHQNQVSTWKKEAMESLSHLFTDKRRKDDRLKEVEVQVDDLHRKVGQLTMERSTLTPAAIAAKKQIPIS